MKKLAGQFTPETVNLAMSHIYVLGAWNAIPNARSR
ncbi:hypothetical protein CM49_03796 [Paenibacillus sp. P1XP2]|nr:hypothetical protein CM49_03796 [Paenibacillus sp. P1XP2]